MNKILLSILLLLSVNIFASEAPRVILETTQGNIELELYRDVAPLAVENFTTHIKNDIIMVLHFIELLKTL